ncbi:MAG: biotin-dependent carboxyltransferase family protein [Granulosicoccus sp.]
MTTPFVEVEHGGLSCTIQDCGRRGLRRIGIPWAGALVPHWMSLANALVGNALDSPVLECFESGLTLKTGDTAVRIAVVGDADIWLEPLHDGPHTPTARSLPAWRSHQIPPDTRIRIRSSGAWRVTVLSISGIALQPHYGSAATYARAALGGLNGKPLQAGDKIPLANVDQAQTEKPDLQCTPHPEIAGSQVDTEPAAQQNQQETPPVIDLRAVPGPQEDAFTTAGLTCFFSCDFILTEEADRMGARLQGPTIEHASKAARDIVTDAIIPGSVQVPGSGQPIAMLADAHTAGGYPKIATIISCDLPKLALCRSGQRFHFVSVDVDEAVNLARDAQQTLADILAGIVPVGDAYVDSAALFQQNLIGGIFDAQHVDWRDD